MIKKLCPLAVALGLTLSPVAHGANWFEIGSSEDGTHFSIDLDSATIRSGTMVVWVRQLHPNNSYAMVLKRFDCENIRVQYFEVVVYNAAGTVIRHQRVEHPAWDSIIPDSVDEATRDKVCFLRELILKASTPPAPAQEPVPVFRSKRQKYHDM